ncbi:hypothetical protein [Spirochaeta cellobiosiphila]|uniref:hypothetical protein n=1 Tax=Spirochaeta cellobiosiphila TaxID=504483 RepID=UPI00040876E2|nr:hypothetical protein [Spirochaeta cellobiosiphila]
MLIVLLLLIILSSCNLIPTNEPPDKSGQLSLTFKTDQNITRSYLPDKGDLIIDHLHITIQRNNNVEFDQIIEPSGLQLDIDFGPITIIISAINEKDIEIYKGTETFEFNENTEKVIQLYPLEGPGNFSFILKTDNIMADKVIFTLRNSTFTQSWTNKIDSSKININDKIQQGIYFATVDIYKEGTLINQINDSVLIFPNLITQIEYIHLDEDHKNKDPSLSYAIKNYRVESLSELQSFWTPYCSENIPSINLPEDYSCIWYINNQEVSHSPIPMLPTISGTYNLSLLFSQSQYLGGFWESQINVINNTDFNWRRSYNSTKEMPLQGIRQILSLSPNVYISANYDNNSLSLFSYDNFEIKSINSFKSIDGSKINKPICLLNDKTSVFVLDRTGSIFEGYFSKDNISFRKVTSLTGYGNAKSMIKYSDILILSFESGLYSYDLNRQNLKVVTLGVSLDEMIYLDSNTICGVSKKDDRVYIFNVTNSEIKVKNFWPTDTTNHNYINGAHHLAFDKTSSTIFVTSFYSDSLFAIKYINNQFSISDIWTPRDANSKYSQNCYYSKGIVYWMLTSGDEIATAIWSGNKFIDTLVSQYANQGLWESPRSFVQTDKGFLIASKKPQELHIFITN